MIFESANIYGIDRHTGEVSFRSGEISLDQNSLITPGHPEDQPLTVNGVHYNDFAIFGDIYDMDGFYPEVGYLVSRRRGTSQAVIVPSHLVESYPEQYVTREMAFQLRSAQPGELEQFCIESILDYIGKSYGK